MIFRLISKIIKNMSDLSVGAYGNSPVNVQEQVGVRMIKGALDFQKNEAASIINMLKEPGIGQNIDIRV